MEAETRYKTRDSDYLADLETKPAFVFRYKLRATIVANAAKRFLGTSGPFRILDFGSANGLTLLGIRSLLPGGTYVGVEYSDEMLKYVKELPSDTRIIKGDALDLPKDVKGNSFDIVSALAILEHLSNPSKALEEAKDALRPGGIFVATCITPLWDHVAKRLKLPHTEWHITTLDKRHLISLVKNSGMELVLYERIMWAPMAFLPYIGIPVTPSFCIKMDKIVRMLKIFDFLFMNNYIVARKPLQ